MHGVRQVSTGDLPAVCDNDGGCSPADNGALTMAAAIFDDRTTDAPILISFDRNPFDVSLDRLPGESDKLDDAAPRSVRAEKLAGAGILLATRALVHGRLLAVTRSDFLCRRALRSPSESNVGPWPEREAMLRSDLVSGVQRAMGFLLRNDAGRIAQWRGTLADKGMVLRWRKGLVR